MDGGALSVLDAEMRRQCKRLRALVDLLALFSVGETEIVTGVLREWVE